MLVVQTQLLSKAIEKLNELGAVVQFELNKSNLRDDAIELLLSVYEIMSKYGNTNFLIEGHTDSSGPKAFNKKLSLERAENVKSHLVSKELKEIDYLLVLEKIIQKSLIILEKDELLTEKLNLK